jgi:hypothetical protein
MGGILDYRTLVVDGRQAFISTYAGLIDIGVGDIHGSAIATATRGRL